MSITTTASKKKIFDGRKMWFIFAGIASVVVAVLAFSIMRGVTATDTYYVLAKDVPARTQITPDLLTPMVTSAGKTPPNALDITQLTENTYSLYSLKGGDILTTSNTGDLLSLNIGLPENFVIASFTANPSLAAGGNVNRGDYIDIIVSIDDSAITGQDGISSSYVLQRVLVIDATVDLDSYSGDSEATTTSADGTISQNTADTAMRSGIPTLFTVGLTQEHAAILATATHYDLFVVLSSADAVDNGNINTAPPVASSSSIWGFAPDAGLGTDNTFGQGGEPKGSNGSTPSKPTTPVVPEPEESEAPVDEGDTGTGEETEAPVDEGTEG